MLTRVQARALATAALRVVNDVARQRFVVTLHNVEAVIEYELHGKTIIFNNTDVPSIFQGKGVGKLLAKQAFDHALKNKLDIVSRCHFLNKFYQDNKSAYSSLNFRTEESED